MMPNPNSQPPQNIKLHRKSKVLELIYANDSVNLTCEYLRVHSPSAEVKGHGEGQEVLQHGKMNVNINAIKPVGNYALLLQFDDGHETGIYSWDYFQELGANYTPYWEAYLSKLAAAGLSREPNTQVLSL